tara:strand:+ start:230 stop:460 length:231 start_codon:yes stop_codon:yes gene_type:complete
MINFIKKIKLVFTYNNELEDLLKSQRIQKLEKEREAKRYNLHLCFDHKQESQQSHYSKNNCDYCKVLKKLGEQNNE